MLFDEALKLAQEKGIMPTHLSSEELRQLKREIRRRAVFSARLDRERVLEVMKKQLELIVSGGRDEYGRLRSISEAKAQLKEAMLKSGLPLSPNGTPAIQDFYSDARRQLIVETSVRDTMNHAQWKRSQNRSSLDNLPAWELLRTIDPVTGRKRNWRRRWQLALVASGQKEGATDGSGRMIALKNHPIWQKLGDGAGGYRDTLGNPWPPFAFNSGMSWTDVDRDEAEALGLIAPEQHIEPQADPGWAENERTYKRDERGKFAEVNAPKRIDADEARQQLRKGFSEKDESGTKVKFGERMLGKMDAVERQKGGESITRLEHLEWGKETVRSGHRIEVSKGGETRVNYLHVFKDSEGGKDRGFVVVVDVKDNEAWNMYRKRKGEVIRDYKKAKAGNERQAGRQFPESVLKPVATVGRQPDYQYNAPRAGRLQALCEAVSRRVA